MAELRNKATLDTKPFNAGLRGMEGNVSSFAGKLQNAYKAAAATAAVAAMVKLGKATLSTADEIDNLAQQTDLGIESVQSLKVVAEELGVQFKTVRPAINQFRRAMDQAKSGSKDMEKAFQALGISSQQLQRMGTEEALEAVARAMTENAGNADVAANATKVLGAESTRILPVLQKLGEDGFEQLNKSMRDTAQIMEKDLVKAGDKMEESLSRALNRTKVKTQSFFAEMAAGAVLTGKKIALIGSGLTKAQKEAEIQRQAEELFGFESVKVQSPQERAKAAEREKTAAEGIARIAENKAQIELHALNKKREFHQMSKEQQREELEMQKALLEYELLKAESTAERLKITEELFDVEKQLGKEAEARGPGGGRLERIGGNATVATSPAADPLTKTAQRQLEMDKKLLAVARAQVTLLKDISQNDGGASF